MKDGKLLFSSDGSAASAHDGWDEQSDCDPFRMRRWIFVIRSFFDDSGKESDPDNRVVCIAGYIAAGEAPWNFFSERWLHQLLANNFSWLHMSDFMSDKGEYAGLNWDWDKKRSVLEKFIAPIKESQLVGFGVAVDAQVWRRVPKEVTRAEGDAQQFCFMRIMRMIVERMKVVRPYDYVSVNFDCDIGFTPPRFQKFLRVRDHDPDAMLYLKSFAVTDPKLYLPLQAADFLAWETRKDLLRKLGGFESRPEFKFIFESLPGYFPDYSGEFWDEAEIERQILLPRGLTWSNENES